MLQQTLTSHRRSKKTQALRYYNYTEIDGKLYHDSTKCYANAQDDGSGEDFDTAATQAAAAALLVLQLHR